jgi:hypothetical protein
VAAVDTKEVTKSTSQSQDAPRNGGAPKPGEPQPVVFPRAGVGLDQRPVSMRREQAASRYRSDGGNPDGSGLTG